MNGPYRPVVTGAQLQQMNAQIAAQRAVLLRNRGLSGPIAVSGLDPAQRAAVTGGSIAWSVLMTLGSLAGATLGAYHGYKRNDSVGWAIGWSLAGSIFWPIALPVMYAQGFAKRKKGR